MTSSTVDLRNFDKAPFGLGGLQEIINMIEVNFILSLPASRIEVYLFFNPLSGNSVFYNILSSSVKFNSFFTTGV